MKHAAVKLKSAVEKAPTEKTTFVSAAKKQSKIEVVSPVKAVKSRAAKPVALVVEKPNVKEKTVKFAAVVAAIPRAEKTAPTLLLNKDFVEKLSAESAAADIKSISAKAKKVAPVADVLPIVESNKTAPAPLPVKVKKTKRKSISSAVSAELKQTPAEKFELIEATQSVPAEFHKIKSAVNVGRINAALKAIEAAQMKAAQVEKSEKRGKNRAAKQLKTEIVEAKIETNIPAKTKPKTVKQIGAAVFRGRKNRYDFQVFPLDFEFENVSAIYVISRRKTDGKKRGHHAFVCIGQTDSLLGELARHTQSKCVKKHEANAVSILTEPNEKKRLKIEEDLRAAHAIVCNIAEEKVVDSELSLV